VGPFDVTWRFLRGGLGRVVLTVSAVACGVALVCAIDLVNRAIFASFVDVLDTMSGKAALHVTAGEGALVPEAVAGVVAETPGVELAVPVVSSFAFLTDGSGELLTIHGVDITNEAAVRVYEPARAPGLVEDALAFLNQPDSVILTETFAARHDLAVDDPLELDTPTGRRRFVVRGLLAPTGIAQLQGGALVVMDIGAAELAFTRPGLVSRIDVVVEQTADVGGVRDALIAKLPPGMRVEAPVQRRVDLHKVLRSVQTLLQAVGIFGLFAAFLIAFSRLSVVFEARVGQLAVLRALGVRARRVWLELVKESVLVGVAGIALGIPAGVGLGYLLLPVIATTTAIGAKLPLTDVALSVRPVSIVLAVAMGLSAVVLAAVLPARRAAAVPVVDTLRDRHVERGPRRGPRRLLLVVIGLAVLTTAWHLVTGTAAAGLVASAWITAGAALATRPFLELAEPLLRRVSGVFGVLAGRYAVATLLRAPRRTALTVATIGVGFGVVLWLWTLAGSFEQSVREVMPGVLRGDLVVDSPNVASGYVAAPLDEALLSDVAKVPGVRAVVGEQTAEWRYAGGPIALNAFDPPYFDTDTFGHWRLFGRVLPDAGSMVARGAGVFVSENFVHNLGVGVGELLTLDTPSGPVSLRIVGVTQDFLSSRGTVLLSRDVYRERWRDTHVTAGLVRVDPGTDPEIVRGRIARALAATYRVRVQRLDELIAWFASQVRRAFAGLGVLALLVIVVVLVGVGDTLVAGTLERTREIGLLRALGVRRVRMGRIVLGEAVVLGLLGVVTAVVFGLGLGVLWVERTFPALIGWTLTLHVPVAATLGTACAVLVACLLAAYVPALRAARLDPVDALRTD
jgi:putative ABC transport system permease protein